MSDKAKKTIESLRSEYGEKMILYGDEAESSPPRVPVGIFSLDVGMGGGLPVGRVTQIYGPESSGKSLIQSKMIAAMQDSCRHCYEFEPDCECDTFEPCRCIFLNAEHDYNTSWQEALGIDTERLYIINANMGERAIQASHDALDSGEFDLLAVNSIAQLAPQAEIEDDMTDHQVAPQARMMNKAFRRWGQLMGECKQEYDFKPTLVLTNQTRVKAGVSFGDPTTRPGGRGQNFASSVEIRLKNSHEYFEGERKTSKDRIDDQPEYVEIRFRVDKNKTAVPNISGTFKLALRDTDDYNKGAVLEKETVFKQADRFGLIKKEGATDWKYGDGKITADRKFKLKEKILEDEEVFRELREKLIGKLVSS